MGNQHYFLDDSTYLYLSFSPHHFATNRALYDQHKTGHTLRFYNVVFPDGNLVMFYGPNDSQSEDNVVQQFHSVCENFRSFLAKYPTKISDRGFGRLKSMKIFARNHNLKVHVARDLKKGVPFRADERELNQLLSALRAPVEQVHSRLREYALFSSLPQNELQSAKHWYSLAFYLTMLSNPPSYVTDRNVVEDDIIASVSVMEATNVSCSGIADLIESIDTHPSKLWKWKFPKCFLCVEAAPVSLDELISKVTPVGIAASGSSSSSSAAAAASSASAAASTAATASRVTVLPSVPGTIRFAAASITPLPADVYYAHIGICSSCQNRKPLSISEIIEKVTKISPEDVNLETLMSKSLQTLQQILKLCPNVSSTGAKAELAQRILEKFNSRVDDDALALPIRAPWFAARIPPPSISLRRIILNESLWYPLTEFVANCLPRFDETQLKCLLRTPTTSKELPIYSKSLQHSYQHGNLSGVNQLEFRAFKRKIIIKSVVHSSMKSTSQQVFLLYSLPRQSENPLKYYASNKLTRYCTCANGLSGCCSHIAFSLRQVAILQKLMEPKTPSYVSHIKDTVYIKS